MTLTAQELEAIAKLVDELCGVVLDPQRGYLIENRLGGIAREMGCANYNELVKLVRAGRDVALREKVIDAITTHETLFFRDNAPFQALQHKIIPEIIDQRARTPYSKRLRLWSAGCSTGQEVYSMAMTLADLIPDYHKWDIQVRGSDISDASVRKASIGHYSKLEIERGMDPVKLRKHFREEKDGWRVKDEIRALCFFERRNLLEPFSGLGTQDVIFCRNVSIYFKPPVRKVLYERLGDRLESWGAIFFGSSESVFELGLAWKPQLHCGTVVYMPKKQRP